MVTPSSDSAALAADVAEFQPFFSVESVMESMDSEEARGFRVDSRSVPSRKFSRSEKRDQVELNSDCWFRRHGTPA